jgi:hypothetical protein
MNIVDENIKCHVLSLTHNIKWNIYSVWGLRGLKKRWWWLLILNRILRRINGRVICPCGRYVYWTNVWAVCCDDTMICNECMKDETDGEYDNGSETIHRFWNWSS